MQTLQSRIAVLQTHFFFHNSKQSMRKVFASLALVILVAVIAPAQIPPALERKVEFKEVSTIFQNHCYDCHGPEKQKSGFRLDRKTAALKGGTQGVAIIPHEAEKSPLVKFIARTVEDMEMPPKSAMPMEDVAIIRTWIDQGAQWPDDPVEPQWWSLLPLKVPKEASSIDSLIQAKLAEHNLNLSPPANRRQLIRRATYGLHGLPPTPEEVEAFVNDSRPDAFAHLVERLLASPRYGEQWGRHWMDVIRFGESRGFERNEIINTAWPFRDYIIQSINENKPFDHFIIEHLAGDQVGSGDPRVEIGTAFLVNGPYDDVGNQDPVQAQIIRANTVDEIINTTSTAFLGLTVSCARCHDHKFDPITTEDYYQLYSILSGVQHGERTIASEVAKKDRETRLKPLEARRAELENAMGELDATIIGRGKADDLKAYKLSKVDPYLTEDTFEPIEALYLRFNIISNNREARSANGVRIDEFEVWSTESTPRNVALAKNGGKASAPAKQAEDFKAAYSPDLVIDGAYTARWISTGPAQLTLKFAKPERINRISFSADRDKHLPASSGEITFVGEYFVEVSTDAATWIKVADSTNRPPLNDSFSRNRKRRAYTTDEDRVKQKVLETELAQVRSEISKVPVLPVAWAGRFEAKPGPVHVMKGGDPVRKGVEVKPASLSAFPEKFELPGNSTDGERRLRFAKWVTSTNNPITPRVLANRLWQYHFGVGLAETSSDFGKLGVPPAHPDLLDFLATQLHTNGWRLKEIHRLIMLSHTYQQSSRWNDKAGELDPDARLLWRFPPRRLSAEEMRDTMLSISGVLSTNMGGQGFKLYKYLQDNVATYIPLDVHGPETYRRAVYHHNARASRIDLLTDFDSPDCTFPAARRSETVSPLQALTLLNHQFTIAMSSEFAKRIKAMKSPIVSAYTLAYSREPSRGEIDRASKFVETHGLEAFARAILNSNELIYLD